MDHGVPCWVETAQPDPERAAEFYGDLFGWEVADGVARRDGRAVAGVVPGGAATADWRTYVGVGSAADAVTRAAAAGGHVEGTLFDGPGGRAAELADPAGATLRVIERELPGVRSFTSSLETTDREGAQAFYGAIFGWEAMEMGSGFWIWRLPGHGDPDAVAWLVPLLNDETGPRWNVTFGVDDVDAAAARAVELGGEIVLPPFAAGAARVAVLRDPQGAELSVSA
jgi:predicted enzyme related to lactoylglutathione lyase